MLTRAGEHARAVFGWRIRTRSRVVANPTPAGNPPRHLLQYERQSGFDRHADHQRAAAGQQAPEAIDHRIDVDDMLEDLHAHDRVVAFAVFTGIELRNRDEPDPGAPKASLAIGDLERIELRTDRFLGSRAARLEHRQERPVAAAVIQQPFAPETPGELEAGFEAAAMTPGDQTIAAEDLLGGVVAVAQQLVEARPGAHSFRPRVSQAPRNVIQNDNMIRRTSSAND